MYKLNIIKNKNTWNGFVNKNIFDFYSFLSSWEWGNFQELAGKKVLRFGIYEKEKLIGLFPLIINNAKRGTYLFAAHTPLILKNYDYFEVLSGVLEQLINISKKQGADFIRLNSPITNSIKNKSKITKLGFIDAPMHEHAEDTHLLNLENTEEELLSKLKKGDRYYINRAKKEGVVVKKGNTKEQIDILKNMHQSHSKKIGYHSFSNDFIDNLYKVFDKNITTISASHNGKVESILMTIRFGNTCVYYIAASEIINHKFSPNYLCQWEAILDAKNKGCKTYNFWGVSPDDNPKHPIAGVTKFKRKFNGYDYNLLHAQDYPITKKYYLNYIIETIRRIKRGYYYKKAK